MSKPSFIKVPRKGGVANIDQSFSSLNNLHLELLENKNKVKKGLPYPPSKIPKADGSESAPAPMPSAESSPLDKGEDSTGEDDASEKVSPQKDSARSKVVDSKVADSKVTDSKTDDSSESKKRSSKDKPVPKDGQVPKDKPVQTGINVEEGDSDIEDLLRDLGKGSDDGGEEPDKEPPTTDATSTANSSATKSDATTSSTTGSSTSNSPAKDDVPPAEEPEEEEELTEEQEHEEYLWRFKILQKKYKGTPREKDIPAFNEHSDLQMMRHSYKQLLRELHIDDAVDSYESYIIFGSMGLEWFATNIMKVDFTGFTAHQVAVSHKYRSLLVELGERPYNSWSTKFPVEIRLLFLIVVQAAVFYIIKYLERSQGGDAADAFRSFAGAPRLVQEKASEPSTPPKKRVMRGPSIKVQDVRSDDDSKSSSSEARPNTKAQKTDKK